MDVLKEIENQIGSLKSYDDSIYLGALFSHIQRAELYYKNGKTDSSYFTDVIYRSNQAFEGALKESYKILAEQSDEEVYRKTPFEIEAYFEKEHIFRPRVLELFKNYRKEWRNKSTHDFKLTFDENEAFIALVSVSSFVHLLLRQIQEKVIHDQERKKLSDEKDLSTKLKQISDSSEKTAIEKITALILEFAEKNYSHFHNSHNNEYEVLGLLSAYFDFSENSINALREPVLDYENIQIRPDFYINLDKQEIILEVKKISKTQTHLQAGVNQLLHFLIATGITAGILYYANFTTPTLNPEILTQERRVGTKTYTITIIIT